MLCLLVSSFNTTTTTLQVNGNDLKAALAKSFADTGLNQMQTAAQQSYEFYQDHFGDYEASDDVLARSVCGNFLHLGIDLDRVRDGELIDGGPLRYRTANDISLNTPVSIPFTLLDGTKGGFEISLLNNGDVSDRRTVVESRGFLGDDISSARAISTSAVSLIVEGGGNVWENAIFAGGTTPNAGFINGNVSVYGSVHIVGTPPNNGVALSVSGNTGIYSNYKGQNNGTDISSIVKRVTNNDQLHVCSPS